MNTPCSGRRRDTGRRRFRRRLSFEPCARSLVAGHYLPLADNPGIAPEPDQTRSLAVGSKNYLRNHLEEPSIVDRGRFQVLSKGHAARSEARKAGRRTALQPRRRSRITSVRPWRRRLPASSCRLRRRPWRCASLTGFGAPSTRSLASFRPRPVSSRTALMTCTLLAPISVQHDVNSVCSSATAAAAPPPPPAARRGHRRGGHAELLFDRLDQVVELHHRHAVEGGDECVFIECHFDIPVQLDGCCRPVVQAAAGGARRPARRLGAPAPRFSATAASTRAMRAIGDCIRPSSCASSTSFDGIEASDLHAFRVQRLAGVGAGLDDQLVVASWRSRRRLSPRRPRPRKSRRSAGRPCCADATSNGVPATARRASVFFST